MKFGIFLPVVRNGFTASSTAPQYDPSFQNNLQICQLAERLGIDFGLAMIKYRGFGGDTGFWDGCLDSVTTISALAASTSRLQYFPSTSVLSIHPAIMARMMVVLDQVSGGRCGLNIVTGWNKPEYSQMGMWPGDDWFGKRYEMASEYVTALKSLWANGPPATSIYRSCRWTVRCPTCPRSTAPRAARRSWSTWPAGRISP